MKRKRAYIDTNIFIYVAINNPDYFKQCRKVLEDLVNGDYEGYGSELVVFELFGSLSKINPIAAYEAVTYYLDLPIKILKTDRSVFQIAREISKESQTSYDAIHAALMMKNNINTIITEDLNDWLRIKKIWTKVSKKIGLETKELVIISPKRGCF